MSTLLTKIQSKIDTMIGWYFKRKNSSNHRINLTLYNLQGVIDGDLDEIIEALRVAENAEKLQASIENSWQEMN